MKFNYKKMCLVLFITFIFSLLGLVSSSTYNFYNADYEIKFRTNIEFDYTKLEDKDYLLTIVNSHSKYSEIDLDKMFKNNDIDIVKNDNEYIVTTGYQYYQEFFISKSKTKGTRVKQFFIDSLVNLGVNSADIEYVYEDVYIIKNNVNEALFSLVGGVIGLVISSLYIFLFKDKNKGMEYDNITIYKTPFYKSYWKESLTFLSSTKKMVTLSMLFSLMLVCKMFSLPSGFSNLGLSLTYLFFSLIGLIYGPIAGISIGLFSDVLGYLLFDKSGMVFYFGYTLQAMLAGFIYGIFLYKTKISFTKCFFARLVVNLFLNVVLGSLFFGDIMNYDLDTIKAYALIIELPKNIIYLLPQSILLFIFLKFVSPILYRNKYISKNIYENINLI